jgi:hypothetical protein
LWEVDKKLQLKYNPINVQEEFPLYKWSVSVIKSKNQKEVPVKKHDHGMDVLRYVCAYLDELSDKVNYKSVATGIDILTTTQTFGRDSKRTRYRDRTRRRRP